MSEGCGLATATVAQSAILVVAEHRFGFGKELAVSDRVHAVLQLISYNAPLLLILALVGVGVWAWLRARRRR